MRVRRAAVVTLGALVLAGLTVGLWWMWLGHDTTYRLDPGATVPVGPYEPLQVIGFVLSLVLLAAAAVWFLPRSVVAIVVTIAFTAAWSSYASANDVTGLWAVGAIGVLVGTGLGSTAVVLAAGHLRDFRRRPANRR